MVLIFFFFGLMITRAAAGESRVCVIPLGFDPLQQAGIWEAAQDTQGLTLLSPLVLWERTLISRGCFLSHAHFPSKYFVHL